MINKKVALSYSKRLDKLANEVQANPKGFGLTPKAAHAFCLQLDQTSDSIEKLADVLERNPDEPYMDYFNVGVIEDDLTPEPTHMEYFKDNTHNEIAEPLEGDMLVEASYRRRQAARRVLAEDEAAEEVEEAAEKLEKEAARLRRQAALLRRASEEDDEIDEIIEEVEKEASYRRKASRNRWASEEEDEVDVEAELEEVEKEASYRRRAASNWYVYAAEVEDEIEEEEAEKEAFRRNASRRHSR